MVVTTALLAAGGVALLAYPEAASWLSAVNQAEILGDHQSHLGDVDPSASEQLAQAHAYNSLLSSGAILAENANVPEGTGSGESAREYSQLLTAPNGVMSRIQIPAIDVDLPIYHGTSDETLLRGSGHLQGTSLPVGGEDTHAVITAHRGLANARMFTDLDLVEKGDIFTVSTFGEVLTYQVVETKVIAPDDTATLRQEPGRDLVSLITCTPLGINTHRILVTGERVTPTPIDQIEAAAGDPPGPGAPWWLLLFCIALVAIVLYAWWGTRWVVLEGRRSPSPAPPEQSDVWGEEERSRAQ